MSIDWEMLDALSKRLNQPRLGGVVMEDLRQIDHALDILKSRQEYASIVKLRSLFTGVVARDTISVNESLQRLTDEAIQAAHWMGDTKEEAHLLGANGHNLHRRGLHQRALENFRDSSRLYSQANEPFEALKIYFMMSQCYRALGNVKEARHVLQTVTAQLDSSDPWFGNPLNVLGWIERDEGNLPGAERMFRDALCLHQQADGDSDILVAGTLADLGEVVGLQGRPAEAEDCFVKSLALITQHEGQYDRQESRTKAKWAELLIREKRYNEALKMLDEADDLVAYGAYKDQLWKIELLRALIWFRQRKLGAGFRRMRSAKNIYNGLGLPTEEFIWQALNRIKLGSRLLKAFRK